MGVYGFDISEYQPAINWGVIPDLYQFAICRAGYGEYARQKDQYFDRHMQGALDAGLDVGCYWFMYALDATSARNNAEAFYEIISPYIGKIRYPLVCDIEGDIIRYMKKHRVMPTRMVISSIVDAFCSYLEDKGFYVSVYSDNSFINEYFSDEILKRYDLWLADWKTNTGKPEGTPNKQCGMWQFTSKGNVKGITGSVDLDYAYLDYPELITRNRLNHLVIPETDETVKKWTVSGGTVTETDTQIIITLDKVVR